jgi:hypothetical protein
MVGAAATYIVILFQFKWYLAVSNNICPFVIFSVYVTLPRTLNKLGVGQEQGSIPQSEIFIVSNDVQF